MNDFGKLLDYFERIKSVRTSEQCPRCRGSGTETVEEVRDLHRSGGNYTRPCPSCSGEGRIEERPEKKPRKVAKKRGRKK